MATPLNFRTALGGFHREDVVHYIEYMNSQHNAKVNQLTNQLEELQQELERLKAIPDRTPEVESLTAQLEEANARHAQLEDEKAHLVTERDDAIAKYEALKAAQAEKAARDLATMELEAYRRAEQAERNAKARADQIYQQATGTLAQVTNQVDAAAVGFRQVAEAMNHQLSQLQMAVEDTKTALQDAATTLYGICVTEEQP